MDYKQKYEQALEYMRTVYPTLNGAAKEDVEHHFPELKESEDEKVRKHLLRHFRNKIKEDWNGMPVKNILAWLEKQKDYEDELEKAYKTADEVQYRIGYEAAKREFEKQGEQKPVERNFHSGMNETFDKLIAIAECLEMDGDCLVNGYTGTECGKFLRDLAREQVERKPAEWSEKDEKMRIKILEALSAYANHVQYTGFCVNAEFIRGELMGWLKSLKLQPKQEWSEEDEEMFDSIIANMQFTQKAHPLEVNQVVYERDINWLKSLKERMKGE